MAEKKVTTKKVKEEVKAAETCTAKHDAVEIFTQDSIVTLFDANNEPVDFFEIALVELDERFYEILQPVELEEGMNEDDALIFEYTVDEDNNGEKIYRPIEIELAEKVFAMYAAAYEDYEKSEIKDDEPKGCASGGGCKGCGKH